MNERLQRARCGLIADAPFFGTLIMRLDLVRDDSIPTFCTDGKHIRYSQKFLDSLSGDEVKGVLVHEVGHCALGHLWRIGGRDMRKWNVATDYAINNMLQSYADECRARGETVPWVLPKGGLLDKRFAGMASEEIYNALPDGESSEGAGGKAAGCGDFCQPAPDDSGDGKGEKGEGQGQAAGAESGLAKDWEIATVQAAQVAKMQGKCPGEIARLIEEILHPRVPWREVLRAFIRQFAKEDYSYRRPNRRFLQTGFILPGLHSERMGRLVCAVDTSGSIDAKTLAEFQAEVQGALDECNPEAVEVIVCDADIQKIQEFQPGDTVKIDARGGGGTDFRPVFDHIAEQHDEPPAACIYLTDLCGSFPDHEPDYPVLWAAIDHGSQKPPWGELVAVK